MANTLTNLLVHIVFSTKYREAVIKNDYRARLYSYIGGIIRNEGLTLLSIGGMPDHIHIALRFRANQNLSDAMRKIKSNSSKWVNENCFISSRFSWQSGYGAFTVSPSQIDRVKSYIENQQKHHKVKSFKEEFIEILDKHRVEYDMKYLWN